MFYSTRLSATTRLSKPGAGPHTHLVALRTLSRILEGTARFYRSGKADFPKRMNGGCFQYNWRGGKVSRGCNDMREGRMATTTGEVSGKTSVRCAA